VLAEVETKRVGDLEPLERGSPNEADDLARLGQIDRIVEGVVGQVVPVVCNDDSVDAHMRLV
jgi:hypothetical protein